MQPDEFCKNLENESGNRRQRRKYRSTAAGKIVWKTIFRRKALAERKQSGELFSDDRRMFVRLQTSESDVPQALQTECPQRVSE